MFYSKCLLSRKGRLGSIWVAAYCFNKLKKSQVAETDIPSSVDKILKDDWDVIAYRVLAYLLLGVVRIYSKKVEYLIDDCHDVLTEINKFVVSKKEKEGKDTLRATYDAVTLPEKFDLDAFDLGILEDVSGGNVVSYEAITLKDCPKGNAVQFSSDMFDYEEFGACHGIFSVNYVPFRDILSSDGMELDMELRTSSNEGNPDLNMENPQDGRFSQEETNGDQLRVPDIALPEHGSEGEATREKLPDLRYEERSVNHETSGGIEELQIQVEPIGEDQETSGEQWKASAVFHPVDEIQEEASLKPSCHVTSSIEDHQINREEINMQSENQICPLTTEDRNRSNFEADRGTLKSCTSSKEDNMGLDKSCVSKKPQKPVFTSVEENNEDGEAGEPTKLQYTIPPDNMNCQFTVRNDTETLGVTTPKLRRVIPTPAIKKAAPISRKRKRKCTFDEITVLPNAVLKQSINDASNLVSKRRKVPETALAAWKTCQIRNLSRTVLEPSLQCVSEELRSLFHTSMIDAAETAELPAHLNVSEPPSSGRPKQVEIAPGPPIIEHIVIEPGTPILEKIEIAPVTPVLHSTSMKSLSSPKSPEALDMDIPEPSGRIEEEPLMENEQAYPSDSVEVPSLDRDQEHDFNLLNEEPNICKEVNPELDGWSKRTRVVAMYLHRQFRNCKRRGEEEVNLLQVSVGKTKKESARLFYETLVLKTNGYVDVKQDEAFGNILLRKLNKWDQTWGDDTVSRDGF